MPMFGNMKKSFALSIYAFESKPVMLSRFIRSRKAGTVLFGRFSVHDFSVADRDDGCLTVGRSLDGHATVDAPYPFAAVLC